MMIKLPQPVSANVYWRKGAFGQLHRSQEAVNYKARVKDICESLHVHPLEGKLRATIYMATSNSRRDTDNQIKVLMDACQGFLFHNDNQVVSFVIERCEAPAPKLENACVIVDVQPLPAGWQEHIRKRMFGA